MRPRILALALICCLAGCAACAPSNPDTLRREATLRTTVNVEQGIRSVYKSLRAGLEECAGPTRADLFETEGTGWIKISMPGFARGEAILLYYDLTTQGQNATLIEGYAAHNMGGWPSTVRYTERWAKGEKGCP